MNQLIKTNNSLTSLQVSEVLSTLDPENQVIVRAALSPKISNITALSAKEQLVDIFSASFVNSGSKIDKQTNFIYANETYDWLMSAFPEVTIEEIRSAVRAGVYGEYGEYFGLNPKSYVMFVGAYLQSEKRRVATAAYQAAKSKISLPVPKMTIAQWKESIMRDFNLMKNGDSNLIVFTPKKYILLRRLGLVGLKSTESWNIWLLRAKESRTWVSSRDARLTGEKGLFSEMQKIYSKFEETGELPMSEFKQIVREARRLRYFGFLEAMLRSGNDDFFNDKNDQDGKEDNPASGGTGSDNRG